MENDGRYQFSMLGAYTPFFVAGLKQKLRLDQSDMVDIFLIVVAVVAICILAVIFLYLLVYYHDKNDAYIYKAVVMIGFVLAGATVLMLPLDVANNEGYAGKVG
jgi:branched-subunit amino acid ABC-type transport system permease component